MSKKASTPPPPHGRKPEPPPAPPTKRNTPCDEYVKEISLAMDNALASRLGVIAREAGEPKRIDVGDSIDRGFILRRLLEEAGFYLVMKK